MVTEYVSPRREWLWASFHHLLSYEVYVSMASMRTQRLGREDKLFWSPTDDGTFTIKSTYTSLRGYEWCDNNKLWHMIWNWRGPVRICSFLWIAGLDCLLTYANRLRKHMTTVDTCNIYELEVETTMHVLGDRVHARRVWDNLYKRHVNNEFFSMGLQEWLLWNLQNRQGSMQDEDWPLKFGVTCQYFWKWRNKILFSMAMNVDT